MSSDLLDTEYMTLVDRVLEQIVKDVANGDLTAIQEMLVYTDRQALEQFLPEEDQT